MERINTPQVFKMKGDTSEEEFPSVAEIKKTEKNIDQREEAIRFFQGLIVSGFFSLLLWAAIFWVFT